MTDLIKRLGSSCYLAFENGTNDYSAAQEAIDHIEELMKERDELGRKLNTARYGQPDFAWSIHEKEMAVLRFKLAKAVEALRELEDGLCGPVYPLSHRDITRAVKVVLAELEK